MVYRAYRLFTYQCVDEAFGQLHITDANTCTTLSYFSIGLQYYC